MKKQVYFLAAAINALFFVSCKKDNQNSNTDGPRITTIEETQGAYVFYRFSFEYGGDGKINKIIVMTDSVPTSTYYNVSYSQNKIVMARSRIKDTTYLFLDANDRVVVRLRKSFQAPFNIPQQTLTFDTTHYEYNSSGLLVKETYGRLDTTWYPGTVQTMTIRTTGTTEHSFSGGDAIMVKTVVQRSIVTSNGSNINVTKRSTENTNTYGYTLSYPNETDFSNAAVLSELKLYTDLPLNKNYSHLPDKITNTYIDKDENGTIISSGTSTTAPRFTYNANGFIDTKSNPPLTLGTMKFVYE